MVAPIGIWPSAAAADGLSSTSSALVVGDKDLLWTTDGVADIGASGASRPANGYFSNQVWAAAVYPVQASMGLRQADESVGYSTTGSMYWNVSGQPLMIYHNSRTDGAGNVAIALHAKLGAGAWDSDFRILEVSSYEGSALVPQVAFKPSGVVRFINNFAVAGAPSGQEGDLAYCTNGDAGSKCLAFFDGANWLRVSLGAAISAT